MKLSRQRNKVEKIESCIARLRRVEDDIDSLKLDEPDDDYLGLAITYLRMNLKKEMEQLHEIEKEALK